MAHLGARLQCFRDPEYSRCIAARCTGYVAELWGWASEGFMLLPSPTTGCRRRQTASARTSLPLSAAPEPQRWAPKARGEKSRGPSQDPKALLHVGGRLSTGGNST